MKKKILALTFAVISFVSMTAAQQQQQQQAAEVTVQLNEQFFEALLDAVFKNTNGLEFGISSNNLTKSGVSNSDSFITSFSGVRESRKPKAEVRNCNDAIRLQRERDGVKTAVRFRGGRISAPIAFTGNYNPPLVGCVEFAGVAETNIELEFDREKQVLVGRARVLNVNLRGAGGIGGGILARLVQSSIDKKINPIQILALDKLSFVVPLQNAGSVRMKAVGVKPEVAEGALNVRVEYRFL